MDPITDMFNRIKNAHAVGQETATIPFSNIKWSLAQILEREGYIKRTEKYGRGAKRSISVELRYNDKAPAIQDIKKVSKSGQRRYVSYRATPRTRFGEGIVILSTSKGLMTGKEAKKQKLGGEIICEVW